MKNQVHVISDTMSNKSFELREVNDAIVDVNLVGENGLASRDAPDMVSLLRQKMIVEM